jgi:glutamyl-tRNA synthetase
LDEAVEMSRYLFIADVGLTEAAIAQLQQPGAAAAIKAILTAIEPSSTLSEAEAQSILQNVTKAENLKRGVVMRSLRAALTGDVNGPDLMQSWLLLNQHQMDRSRLEQALSAVAA